MMLVLLMTITIIAVVALVLTLVINLHRIHKTLMKIGGAGDSYLAKLRLGLRAIESETGHLPTEVTKLNEGLTQTADGLKGVNDSLAQSINSALKQKKYN
ncbi:MAG: hypothetical protein RJQ09_07940 [Cyclobacteriaceae bacterium]